MANCWLQDPDQIFSEIEFELWRNAVPSALQLQKTMLKSGKI